MTGRKVRARLVGAALRPYALPGMPDDPPAPPDHGRSTPHTHLTEFPEALETLLTRLPELTVVLGSASAEGIARVQALVREGLAARARGDIPQAVERIVAAMSHLAAVAGRSGTPEAAMLAAMAERFAGALRRGAVAEAREAAEVMRERSGTRLVPRDGDR